MKSLIEFIKENLNYTIFSIDSVNAEIQDKIDEALTMSYDTDKLIDKIANHYAIPKKAFLKTSTKSKNRAFDVSKGLIEKYLDDKWLNDTLLFFGYYISKVGKTLVIFEPIFTDNITDIIQDDCNGKIYKIISNELRSEIEKRGGLFTDRDLKSSELKKLAKSSNIEQRKEASKAIYYQIKNANRLNDFGYRMFTSRLFFFSGKDNNSIQEAKIEILRQLSSTINKDNYTVLEIDISDYNVNCYIDTFTGKNMLESNFYLFYINAFFPINLITFYDNEEFDKKFS